MPVVLQGHVIPKCHTPCAIVSNNGKTLVSNNGKQSHMGKEDETNATVGRHCSLHSARGRAGAYPSLWE